MSVRVVVVGASWGGLDALTELLAALPPRLDAAVAIAQHRKADGGNLLTMLLQRSTAMPVREIEDKDGIEPGVVYVAPADYHVLVEAGRFALSVDERVQHSRPSIDVLFETAADAYGERVVGVVLTGANADGAAGLAHVRRRGGVALVQDPATASRPEMPLAAIEAAAPDAVADVPAIAARLADLCGGVRT